MGKDIFEHYELWDGEKWIYLPLSEQAIPEQFANSYFSHPAVIDRNYELFHILSEPTTIWTITPIAPRRGLPADATREVREFWKAVEDDPALFGVSWVTLEELLAFNWEMEIYDDWDDETKTARERAGSFCDVTLPYLQTVTPDPKRLRLVFWFGV